ncbi:MAG: hypothetical protein NTV88_01360, partial [Candidatus Micrarchaeota archaeon]|nr:hypothetical protein [Candidatus Micrarchaeota archaeon]
MASNLPSSFGQTPSSSQQPLTPPPSMNYKPQMPEMPKIQGGDSNLSLPTILAGVALLLSLISFYSDSGSTFLGNAMIDSNGYVNSSPEPSTWALLALSLTVVV